ncbi:MAG TPA: Gfo/Idh/MocA family oxidoreductase [Opitutaceae bacterium]
MTKPTVIGVVGCGYWGPNLVRNFRSASNCRLKSMCDMNEDRLRHLSALYPEVAALTAYDALLNDPEVDAIAVATSVRFHYAMARSSLLASKHTLVEKPLAASPEQCEELIQIAQEKNLILMVGHTFLFSPAVNRIKEIIDHGDIGEIRYIAARRLNLGLFQKDINVAWDLAPHDLSIILHILEEMPHSVNCRGSAHVTPGIEDVTAMTLNFRHERSAIVHSSWLDPRKIREMTIVGSKRMIVYDDIAPLEKIKIFDTRVERPPHYDTFADFHYAYHYGDMYIPHVKQEEPLKNECQHFVDCIRTGRTPITSGERGLEVVRVLAAASESVKAGGSAVMINARPLSNAAVGPTSDPATAVSNGSNGNGKSRGLVPV